LKKQVYIFLIFILAQFQVVYAQINTFDSGFMFIASVIEQDYAGFFDKTGVDKDAYKNLKKEILAKSKDCYGSPLCQYLLFKKFLTYFNDPHLNLGFNADGIRKNKLFNERNQIYEEKVQALSKLPLTPFSRHEINNLTGSWEDENEYVITIKQITPYIFEGVISSGDSTYWFPGQSKFVIIKKGKKEYFSYFLGKDHFFREVQTNIVPNEVVFGKYGRVFKGGNYFKSISQFQLSQIKKGILYFRIPNFLPENTSIVDSIVHGNHDDLLKASHLILDIRNNQGGSSQSFQSLLPYLLTGPYKISGSKIRKSERNTASYTLLSKDSRFDSAYQKGFADIADSLRACTSGFYTLATDSEIKPDTVYSYPRKVIFLTNERTGSAAEFILVRTRESKKCIIVGQETYGALDYTDANRVFIPSHPYIRINYPVIRSSRVDWPHYERNSGVKPNINLWNTSSEWVKTIISFIQLKKM
jgi:Peptidase family S41